MEVRDLSVAGDPDTFDLDRYLRTSKRVDLSAVEWDRMGEVPLRSEEARCIAYMMDIETNTSIFMRDILATRAAADANVSAFLACWNYEEYWHGEAFSRFLGEAGWELAPDPEVPTRDTPYPSRFGRVTRIRRDVANNAPMRHMGTLLASIAVPDSVALHMTWGAINELTTLSAYHLLTAKTEHPVLPQLLAAVIKDERRHFAFYRSQALLRLRRSASARRITRWGMDRFWQVVGTGVVAQSETDFITRYLFDDEGLATVAEIDRTIEQLPGMEGLQLAWRAVNRMRERRALPPNIRLP